MVGCYYLKQGAIMKKVLIYSTKTCPYCHLEKDYLDSKGVKYEEILLDEHPEKIQEYMDACGGRGVPCTHITHGDGKEEHILGFDKARIDAVLNIK
jgi:glutaredoxin